MADGKRYYWLKLYDDFFGSIRIKKLRRMAGGDTYVIIYLKLQLKAMKTDGVLKWKGYEQDFVEELALDLDEEPDDVRVTLMYLLSCGLAETQDNVNFFFPYAVENVGSEGASAQRVREYRERQALQCNTDVTPMKQIGNGEIDTREKIQEIDTRDRDREDKPKRQRFVPPTIEEITAYCRERNNNVDVERFHAYYTANGWKVGKNPMKDWKAAVRTWERDDRPKGKGPAMKTAYDGIRIPQGDDSDRLAERMGVKQ